MKELIRVSIEQVIVDWIGHPGHHLSPEEILAKSKLLAIEAKQLNVGTQEVWQNEIENNSYVVNYHDGKGVPAIVTDSNAVHYTLQEYGAKYGAEYSSNARYRSKTDDILVSAFHTFKNKRVIVDGIHRGAVIIPAITGNILTIVSFLIGTSLFILGLRIQSAAGTNTTGLTSSPFCSLHTLRSDIIFSQKVTYCKIESNIYNLARNGL